MTTQVNVHEALNIHIFGSGMLSYPWWVGCSDLGYGWKITSEDPDEYGEVQESVITDNDILAAARKCVEADYGSDYASVGFLMLWGTQYAANLWNRLDLDADAADIIVQEACFGEVVYG